MNSYMASRRRNHVLADTFSRLKHMERGGSGFRKRPHNYLEGSGCRLLVYGIGPASFY